VPRKTETEVGRSEEAEDSNMGIKVMYRFLAMTFCLLIESVWCFFGLFSAAFVQITLKQHGSLVVFLSAAAADGTTFIRVVSHVPCFDFRANVFFFWWCCTGFDKIAGRQCTGCNEGAEIRELLWSPHCYRCQHEHLPIPGKAEYMWAGWLLCCFLSQ